MSKRKSLSSLRESRIQWCLLFPMRLSLANSQSRGYVLTNYLRRMPHSCKIVWAKGPCCAGWVRYADRFRTTRPKLLKVERAGDGRPRGCHPMGSPGAKPRHSVDLVTRTRRPVPRIASPHPMGTQRYKGLRILPDPLSHLQPIILPDHGRPKNNET